MKNIRSDLIDDGVYHVPVKEKKRAPRCPPTLISQNSSPQAERIELLVDYNGSYTAREDMAVAKCVIDENKVRMYFVKFGTTGPDQGRMINPRGLYFKHTDLNKVENRLGRARYSWKRVPMEVFQAYTEFLTTKNETFLRTAERVCRDG